MARKRTAWWLYLVGISFVAVHILVLYLVFWGPADPDRFNAKFDGEAMRIVDVPPDSEYARMGLMPGDRVLTVSGRPVRNTRDWAAVNANLEVGRDREWQVFRGQDLLVLHQNTMRASLGNRLANSYPLYLGLALGCFLLGLLIGLRRPQDPTARIGAWFIMTASIAFGLPNGWAASWRQLPLPIQGLLWIPEVSRFVIEGIFLSFIVMFPRRLFKAWWPWLLIWGPVLATVPWRIAGFHSVIYNPGGPAAPPGWLGPLSFTRTLAFVAAGVSLLALSYRRLGTPNERRRVRVLVAGTAVSLLAAIPIVWMFTFRGQGIGRPELMILVFFPLTLVCPFAFAYSILRHRMFDIHVIVRQGLQYALARGAVLGVVPAVGVVFASDLFINNQQPIAQVAEDRGWIYALLGGLALLAYWRRGPWLDSLDRRFFRERYNAQRVLRDVAEEIRQARSFEAASGIVVARIEAALHPQYVSLMVRKPQETHFHSLAIAPATEPPLTFPADSKLVALARVLERPLEDLLAESSWLDRRLPVDEIEVARAARIDLLVPIATVAGKTEAILALGAKRSEEPYAREDQELLEAIAANLALQLDQSSRTEEAASRVLEECGRCGTCHDAGVGLCPHDGSALIPVHLPRSLAARYRLERRRGRGGMGTVYEATDTALGRRVAVKVLKEDLVGNNDAAQRFGREARAAAGFAHPNVVTVHDFGIEGGTNAFLVMELLEGVTLRDLLKTRLRLEPSRTLGIFRGVCAAVEAAHHRQLIHRDLKPENIFLVRPPGGASAPEIVKVLDFGLAKFLAVVDEAAETQTDTLTRPGVLVGTPAYMCPEQLLGENPDPRWDLWALAVVAYEAMAGTRPFGGASIIEFRRAVVAGDFIPLHRHVDDPPPQWQRFFARCFATSPAERPGSVAEFLAELERALM